MPALSFAVPRPAAAIVGILLAAGVAATTPADPLDMPRAGRQAYPRGTRSPDGRPGPKYWQNHGRYSITITASPPDRTIRGTEQIVYANNSPDTLGTLIVKLLLNIHKQGAPRDGGASA